MCRFTEAICIKNGFPQRLEYHERRCNLTRSRFFPGSVRLDLAEHVDRGLGQLGPDALIDRGNAKYKCRIVYGRDVEDVSITPYRAKTIKTLRLIRDDAIDYAWKYSDRRLLDELYALRGEADMVLIVKNGYITDTTFSNVAFYDGSEWVVPHTYLLEGTMRRYLLDVHRVREVAVGACDIHKYEKIALINAMLELGDTVLSTSAILAAGERKG